MKLFKFIQIKSLSIYQFTLFLILASSIISITLVAIGWAFSEKQNAKNEINQLTETAIDNQKEKLKSEATLLINYLEYIQKDTAYHSTAQIKEEVLLYFGSLRFGNDGYVFVNTYDGIALLFDGQKVEETKNITNLTDPKGFRIFDKELELAKLEDGGAFQYLFKKIYTQSPEPKLSYVKGFDEWNWIVGVGDYIDNLDDEISLLEQQLKKEVYNRISIAIGILVFILTLIVYFSNVTAKAIQNQFNKFVRIIKQTDLSKKNKRPFDLIFIRELKEIAFDIAYTEERVNQFGNIIDQSLYEIYIFDQEDYHFVHVNTGARKNIGYSNKELLKMTPLDINPELTKTLFLALLKPLINKNQIHLETVHQRKDKSFYPVDVYIAKSIFNKKPVYIAFIYDISIRKEAEKKLKLSNKRYIDLFNNAPISLWEEDYTDLANYLDTQLEAYNLPVDELLEKHPEVLSRCSELAKVIDVNKQTLSLYEADSKEELLGNLSKIFTDDSFNTFKQSLIAFKSGKGSFRKEGKNISLKQKNLDLILSWSFLSDEGSNSNKVIVSVIDITDLRKTEKDLLDSEKRFGSIFKNNHTIMFLIDPENGRIIDANPAAVNFYGYTYEEFVNTLSVYDLNTLNEEEVLKIIDEAKNKKRASFYIKQKLANGSLRDVEIYSGALNFEKKPVLFSIVHDVTDKKEAENLLLESKNKMESVFRAAPTGIGVVSDRVLTEVNEQFCDIVGYSKEELIGKQSHIIYPSMEEFEWVGKEKYRQISEKGTGTVETLFKRKDGKIINALLSSAPIDLSDLSKGVTFTALDITERTEINKELENHRNQLRALVDKRTAALEQSQNALLNLVDDMNIQTVKLEKSNLLLSEINEDLETFTYSVSHDLKAPLRGIDGYSQLLAESIGDDLDEESKIFLANIRSSSQQMNLLIEDLLAYSRLERKGFIHEPLKLTYIMDDILRQYQSEIETHKIKISRNCPENFILNTDKESLLIVIRNLIDNAIKFSAKEEKPTIEIGSSQSDTEFIIFVQDNGIGFDMKYHSRIFKIFQRLHLAEEYQGTGIGLAMVSKAVQRMNGQISAESSPGNGACFTLRIGK